MSYPIPQWPSGETAWQWIEKDKFLSTINSILAACMDKPVKVCFVEYTDDNKDTYDEVLDSTYFMSYGYPFGWFSLMMNDAKVSTILTYFLEANGKVYYGLHSYTPEEYEGRKYNQILRAIFVISADWVKFKGKDIDFLGLRL